MPVATALAIFFLIWWVVLFAVLPRGIKSQHEGDDIAPGTDPGAPTKARVGWKLLWTTVMAIAIYAVFYLVYVERSITVDGLISIFDKLDNSISLPACYCVSVPALGLGMGVYQFEFFFA